MTEHMHEGLREGTGSDASAGQPETVKMPKRASTLSW